MAPARPLTVLFSAVGATRVLSARVVLPARASSTRAPRHRRPDARRLARPVPPEHPYQLGHPLLQLKLRTLRALDPQPRSPLDSSTVQQILFALYNNQVTGGMSSDVELG